MRYPVRPNHCRVGFVGRTCTRNREIALTDIRNQLPQGVNPKKSEAHEATLRLETPGSVKLFKAQIVSVWD